MMRAFDHHEPSHPGLTEAEAADVKTVVSGVIKMFTSYIYVLPSAHAVKAYKMLVTYIERHYGKPVVFEQVTIIRYMVSCKYFTFNCIFTCIVCKQVYVRTMYISTRIFKHLKSLFCLLFSFVFSIKCLTHLCTAFVQV